MQSQRGDQSNGCAISDQVLAPGGGRVETDNKCGCRMNGGANKSQDRKGLLKISSWDMSCF